jgi:hypothetical protein
MCLIRSFGPKITEKNLPRRRAILKEPREVARQSTD